MLIFIDESGDTGFKFEHGSSQFFTMSLIIFENHDEAIKCNKSIADLKRGLGWNDSAEFHFKRNSDKIRIKFLKNVSKFDFAYYGIVIDKTSFKYKVKEFKNREYFYSYICFQVIESAQKQLIQADVVIDKNSNPEFMNRLSKFLKKKININQKRIKKIKMQRSEANSLLQLADYVAGIINRSVVNKKNNTDEYRRILKAKEVGVKII